MLSKLTSEQFKPHQNRSFKLLNGNQTAISLNLVQVSEKPGAAMNDTQRTPFSLLFKAAENVELEDGCYCLTSDDMDSIDNLFINRIVSPGDLPPGAYFQAVFN